MHNFQVFVIKTTLQGVYFKSKMMGQYTTVNHINNKCCVGHKTVQLIAKTRAANIWK